MSCLQIFYRTSSAWSSNGSPVVWPTILNAIAALIIVIWSGIVLSGYIFGAKLEKRLEGYSPWAAFIQTTLTTFATAIMMGTAAQPNSLEGQTCGNSNPAGVDPTSFCFKQVRITLYQILSRFGNGVEFFSNGYAYSDLFGSVDVPMGEIRGIS